MAININVDLLLYINLDNREDRRAHMERQLINCPWPLQQRLSATRLTASPEESGMKMHPPLVGQRGVASIWISHKRAIAKFIENDGKGAFVLLEDDVVIFNEFWASTANHLAGLPSNWDIVLFTPKYRYRRETDIPEDEKGRKFARSPNGNKPVFLPKAAKKYIITGAHFCVFRNVEVAKKIIDRMNSLEEIYDVDRFYVLNFNTYGIKSHHISSGGFGSDHDG